MKIINEGEYPWLAELPSSHNDSESETSFVTSEDAKNAIQTARIQLKETGAVSFPNFLTNEAVQHAVEELQQCEDQAHTTDEVHTAHLKDVDLSKFPKNSVYNHQMPTKVASTAFDELSENSVLKSLYHDPRLLQLVSRIVDKELYLSDDPLGCCSVNVFRPHYHHSFHYDESEFSVTLMFQTAENPASGLFQYTNPLRNHDEYDLALEATATALHLYDHEGLRGKRLSEFKALALLNGASPPVLHTLDFQPGTFLVLAGSKSLHRVTEVRGMRSRLVAVLTFASRPGFCNSAAVQKMFWGRSHQPTTSQMEDSDNKLETSFAVSDTQ